MNKSFVRETPYDQRAGTDSGTLLIQDIIHSGRCALRISEMVLAVKQGISAEAVEELMLLRSMYPYSFKLSLKYLRKEERLLVDQYLGR